jgi:hypothetical protein
MDFKIQIPTIPAEELTPTVKALLDIISQCVQIIEAQQTEIQLLKDEIARLKGRSPKPKLKPSKLEEDIIKKKPRTRKDRKKRQKPSTTTYREEKLKPANIPAGSEFKGYKNFTVQNIEIQSHTIVYRRECWITPDGEYIVAPLPDEINGHYGIELKQYILHLNYDLNVPQKLILDSLNELGIRISAGQLNNILIKGHDVFHNEKEELLETGLKISSYLSVDDTGARHNGKNGYCTHIGNDSFSYFKSTGSKSRINFLKILRGSNKDYVLSEESFEYMKMQNFPPDRQNRLIGKLNKKFDTDDDWEEFLKMVGIRSEKDIRIVTESALMGSILSHGINRDLVILSDDAGQFEVLILLHALCWLHAERKLTVIVPINDYQKKILDDIRGMVWNFYQELKEYKQSPSENKKQQLENKFDVIFSQKTIFEDINNALYLIWQNKKELLLVLKRPEVPLHNNISENSIRIFATKRKVHGGTRSETGRDCRDTFMSLKKSCRKLGISFRAFILDRLAGRHEIPQLSKLLIDKICEPPVLFS